MSAPMASEPPFVGSMASQGFHSYMARALDRWEQRLQPLICALEHDGLWAMMTSPGGGLIHLEIRKAGDPIDPLQPFVLLSSDGTLEGSDCASLYEEQAAGPYFLCVYFEGNGWGVDLMPSEADWAEQVSIEHVGIAAWKLLEHAGVSR